jgi:hypothetical protein
MARLTKLIQTLLHLEKDDEDRRIVLIDVVADSRKIVGVKEEGNKIIIMTKEK